MIIKTILNNKNLESMLIVINWYIAKVLLLLNILVYVMLFVIRLYSVYAAEKDNGNYLIFTLCS